MIYYNWFDKFELIANYSNLLFGISIAYPRPWGFYIFRKPFKLQIRLIS